MNTFEQKKLISNESFSSVFNKFSFNCKPFDSKFRKSISKNRNFSAPNFLTRGNHVGSAIGNTLESVENIFENSTASQLQG